MATEQELRAESERCPKPGCGAMKLIGNPCTDGDCPQKWVRAKDYAALQRCLAEAALALRTHKCSRPCNKRPDNFTIGECIDAGECGCNRRAAALSALAEHDADLIGTEGMG